MFLVQNAFNQVRNAKGHRDHSPNRLATLLLRLGGAIGLENGVVHDEPHWHRRGGVTNWLNILSQLQAAGGGGLTGRDGPIDGLPAGWVPVTVITQSTPIGAIDRFDRGDHQVAISPARRMEHEVAALRHRPVDLIARRVWSSRNQ